MARGRVKWYSSELGYGFILPEDGSGDVLVRAEDVAGDEPELENNVEVTYEAIEGEEGLEARNVTTV